MSIREYIGARYVPIFGRKDEESIIWDNTKPYEPLTVVLYQGNSYTSRQFVPIGIAITNELYWAQTGNYNAQVEQYRQEVFTFDDRITANAAAITAEETAREAADDALQDDIEEIAADLETEIAAREATDANVTANANAIATETTARELADTQMETSFNNLRNTVNQDLENQYFDLITRNCNIPKRIVCIGDSYGRGVGGISGGEYGWPYYINQYLNPIYMCNISNSGAGFVKVSDASTSGPYTGQNFNGQLTIAYDQVDADSATQDTGTDLIDTVIIAGGYNDHGQSGVYSATQTIVRKARQLFPSARIHVFPLAVPRGMNSEFHGTYNEISDAPGSAGGASYNQAEYWLFSRNYESVMNSDDIHPTDEGYKIIARYMASSILGGTMLPEVGAYGSSAHGYELATGVTSNGFRCGVNQGMAWMCGGFNVTSPTNGQALCTLPFYLRPVAATRYFLAIGYGTATAPISLRLRLQSSGVLDLQSAVSPGDASLLGNVTTVYILPFCMPLNVM